MPLNDLNFFFLNNLLAYNLFESVHRLTDVMYLKKKKV